MSLKAFHLIFIIVSLMLSLFVSVWAIGNQNHFLLFSGLAGIFALTFYLIWWFRTFNVKAILLLVLLLLTPKSSLACAVCFSITDQATKVAYNKSIFFLLGLTALVLVGLTVMVVRLIRQATHV